MASIKSKRHAGLAERAENKAKLHYTCDRDT